MNRKGEFGKDRDLLHRMNEHVKSARALQKYWVAKRENPSSKIAEPALSHQYPIVAPIALSGISKWAFLPLEWIPIPEDRHYEDKEEWERVQKPYENMWIEFAKTAVPFG